MPRLIERVEAMLPGEIPGPPAAQLIGFRLLSSPGPRFLLTRPSKPLRGPTR